MIFPITSSRYEILKCIYNNPNIKISDVLKLTKTSQRTGYVHINNLLKAGIISETLEGTKPTLRLLRPNFTEAGKLCFALIEMQRKLDFFNINPKLRGAFLQFENETKNIIETALIFGSFAKGSETDRSDIDLAIIAKQNIKNKLDKILEHCFVTLKNRVSARLFNPNQFVHLKKDEFILQIVKNHVVVVNAQNWINILAESNKS